MRELSEETLQMIEATLADAHVRALALRRYEYSDDCLAALAEFREWREYMAQRQSFAAGNVSIDRDPDARRTVAVEGSAAGEKAPEPSDKMTTVREWLDRQR